MRILVTGACGLLGSHFMAALAGRHEVMGTDRHPWWGALHADVVQGDLADAGFVKDLVAGAHPELVIHCAAAIDVDDCERHPEAAYLANVQVTQTLAMAAGPEALFLYMSTDSVFAGDHPFAAEEDPPAPLNAYARSKLDGERFVSSRPRHLIVRTNFYGWSSGRKPTFAEWLYSSLRNAAPMTLYDDVFFTPIYAVDLVQHIELLLQRSVNGLYHMAGRDRVSKYEFGMRLASLMGIDPGSVVKGSVHSGRHAAARSRDMSLRVDRVEHLLGRPLPDCGAGLSRFLYDRHRPLHERFAGA